MTRWAECQVHRYGDQEFLLGKPIRFEREFKFQASPRQEVLKNSATKKTKSLGLPSHKCGNSATSLKSAVTYVSRYSNEVTHSAVTGNETKNSADEVHQCTQRKALESLSILLNWVKAQHEQPSRESINTSTDKNIYLTGEDEELGQDLSPP